MTPNVEQKIGLAQSLIYLIAEFDKVNSRVVRKAERFDRLGIGLENDVLYGADIDYCERASIRIESLRAELGMWSAGARF